MSTAQLHTQSSSGSFASDIMHLMGQTLRQSWGLIVALIALVVIFSLTSPYFLNIFVFDRILTNASFTLIMATGMTLVIATGGIDVSVGATLALTSVVAATLMSLGLHWIPAASIGLILGAAIGATNGSIISYLRLQPFIVTLAMLSLARGLTLIISNGSPVRSISDGFSSAFKGDMVMVIGFSILILTMIVIHRTRIGIHLRGIGGSEPTSFICGIPVNLMRVGVYSVQGALAVLAGYTLTASFNAAEPTAGLSTEWLEALAAPIIGGNTMAGGRIRLFGTLMGCLLLATMRSGLNISGVPVAWQQIAIGLIIVSAVAIDVFTQRKKRD
ncbi:ABC transporter permease [Ahrensia kielensis]|uniref:ABC transporter permease n=1 Tax=Ahrensia kielensis TaxID=76980 RepID=A0ABU9TAG9_9HYPH